MLGERAALALLLAGLAAGFALSLALGSVRIPLDRIWAILVGEAPTRASWDAIVLDYRLPKALTAMLCGAALGVGGLLMQTLFRNPLAEPYLLGVSSGAGLGVALVVLGSGGAGGLVAQGELAGALGTVGAAVGGAAVSLLLVLALARRVSGTATLLILGLMLGYLTSSLVSVLIHFSAPERIQAYIAWGLGSFAGVGWQQLRVLAPAVGTGLLAALLLAKPLNALLLGETYARSMGLRLLPARLAIISAASLLAGAVTAYCGPVTFLGIAVPHLARVLFRGAGHGLLAGACILLGALIALLADLTAGLPGRPEVLPLNAVTALIGAPIVLWVLLSRRG
jgi:iron complex transport system permease protein